MNPSRYWRNDFDDAIPRRVRAGEPDWGRGSKLPRSVVKSLQKFQVGESGDGAHLIAKADSTGDTDYAHAVRLFVAEERNHARMLEELLCVAGAVPIDRHWSDAVFVRLRRSMGLRMEIMILAIAEVIALRYYRALAEGDDALLTEVAERILADEVRHVPFQCHRLRVAFARTPTWQRAGIAAAWRGLALAVSALVAVDPVVRSGTWVSGNGGSSSRPGGCSPTHPTRRSVRPANSRATACRRPDNPPGSTRAEAIRPRARPRKRPATPCRTGCAPTRGR